MTSESDGVQEECRPSGRDEVVVQRQYTVLFIGNDSGDSSEQRILCYLGGAHLDFLEPGIRIILSIECSIECSAYFLEHARATPWSETDFDTCAKHLIRLPPLMFDRVLFFFPEGDQLPDLRCLRGNIPWSAFRVGPSKDGFLYELVALYDPDLSMEIDSFPLLERE